MGVTVVNDDFFKPGGDVAEGKAAARDLVRYFTDEVPEVELSLWLESQENPLYHDHITVFSDEASLARVRESDAIKTFVSRLFPHIDHSTYVSPHCQVWLAGGSGVRTVDETAG